MFLGIFSKVVAIPAALSAALIVPAIGCYWSWVLGSCAASLGFLCFTTLGHWGPYATMLIWTLSFSLVKPASYAARFSLRICAANLRCAFQRFRAWTGWCTCRKGCTRRTRRRASPCWGCSTSCPRSSVGPSSQLSSSTPTRRRLVSQRRENFVRRLEEQTNNSACWAAGGVRAG